MMMMDKEVELRAALQGLSERLRIEGYLYLYLEGDKIKIVGNMSLSALAPLILEWVVKRKL